MNKKFSEEQRKAIYDMHKKGVQMTEIAKKMMELYPKDWTSKHSIKSVQRILGELNVKREKTLDEMTRDERFQFIDIKLKITPRFRMAFKNFTDDDKEVFVDEYLNVIKSTDSLTEAEEQSLFTSILELVLALQALNRKEEEEQLREKSLAGQIPINDPRYRTHVDSKYQVEYDQHMKLYQKGMEQQKMLRKQRLDEVRSQKMTLVDLAENLSSKNAQSEASEEIERLSKLKDTELKKLIENNYIFGLFEDYL